MLKQKMVLDASTTEYLKTAFARPEPRLAEGNVLMEQGVRCAIDISDGLIADLAHICQASGVEAEIKADCLPIRVEVNTAFGDQAQSLAISGGEDYQLLFTASQSVMQNVQKICSYPITVIGEIKTGSPGRMLIIEPSGKRTSAAPAGWDHFKKN